MLKRVADTVAELNFAVASLNTTVSPLQGATDVSAGSSTGCPPAADASSTSPPGRFMRGAAVGLSIARAG